MKKNFLKTTILMLSVLILAGCGNKTKTDKPKFKEIDMSNWHYDSVDNVYYQLNLLYVKTPRAIDSQKLGIFVPGDYFIGTKNRNGTYKVTINQDSVVNGYTANCAPYILPINNASYKDNIPPQEYYQSVKEFTDAGFIYVWAGSRGNHQEAPAAVVDFKAAIRFTRMNKHLLPGDTDKFFSLGIGAGGGISAVLGASGDSELFTPYLEDNGAYLEASDAITGAMTWCPITSLDTANEAYEWNLGSSRYDLEDFPKDLSNQLATKYAEYINELNLKDDDGNLLSLKKSKNGIYQAGSYYEWLKEIVETSLNNFLEYTEFPYEVSTEEENEPEPTNDNEFQTLKQLSFGDDSFGSFFLKKGAPADDSKSKYTETGTVYLSGVYNSPKEYIDALNEAGKWVNYKPSTNTVKITSLADFSRALKVASRDVCAFDSLENDQEENKLFGNTTGNTSHFDSILAELLVDTDYEFSFATDLKLKDTLGKTIKYRMNAYNPLFYISEYYPGYKTSKVAEYWRIRSGIFQNDTSLCTEANLSQALKNYGTDVDFATVWGVGYEKAEEMGTANENFILWVNQICK